MIIGIIISFVIVMAIFEFSSRATYGKFLKDEEVFDYLYEFEPFEKNPFNSDILGPALDKEDPFNNRNLKILKSNKFIGQVKLSILCKYYISTVGMVPRWSKAHSVIKYLHQTSPTPNL
jgi:hypothetical protein